MGALRTEQLDYELPAALVATRPAEPRDSARMLVVHCASEQIEHRSVRDLPMYLADGDLLVFNDTAVAPARLVGRRVPSGAQVQGLFLAEQSPGQWRLLLKANRRLQPDDRIELTDAADQPSGEYLDLAAKNGAQWTARLVSGRPARDVLDRVGRTPLPPYILRARQECQARYAETDDRRWYQTVYADALRAGSVAAPTAGLHFTPELLEQVRAQAVALRHVTLHVGPGTFKPISAPTLSEHEMHTEWYEAPAGTVAELRARDEARRMGRSIGRTIAVGTTTVRTLESLPDDLGTRDGAISGETNLLIAPGHRFRRVDGMLTNFHLPRSTLLALVAAMVGLERLLDIYREAVRQRYRFYSYGDAMLILP